MRGNDDCTFAKSTILVENVTGDDVVFRSLGTGKSTSEIFGNLLGNLRTSSDIFGHLRILSVPCEKSWHSQDKNVTPMNHKKLADIHGLLHVFKNFAWRTSFRSQLEVPVLSRSAVWSLSVSNFLKKRFSFFLSIKQSVYFQSGKLTTAGSRTVSAKSESTCEFYWAMNTLHTFSEVTVVIEFW